MYIYKGPLRLLAWEIFDRLNKEQVRCNLETGEERCIEEDVGLTACTTEMVNMEEIYDVAVLDEIQIMSATSRGGAWTRALLGIRAKELHLCGDESVKQLVGVLAQRCGDDIEFREYKRLCPLRVDKPLTNFTDIRKGDCIVGFSRNDIYELKRSVESTTPFRCALVYGRLPPPNRRTQAQLFNDQEIPYDVLIASDAIGTLQI
ncbi:hypothetical protein RFI_14333 [Reticulomyxa filosa]|uniref:ATP-dependent RNA helicase SUV3 DEXQ-box helicase domain-containing protein n=1 Tax=Reticulomyxa filosa TaxID=46433 RepID=X6NA11_RETFI|nr:hypothetical protein RFI_14333 [Reticulomyxa filosa]|eukprot:ETO22856.1 hypothetical protein RFI_14333 [Reticulomyxa filosa]